MNFILGKKGILIILLIAAFSFLYLFTGAFGETRIGLLLRANSTLEDGLVAHYTFDADTTTGTAGKVVRHVIADSGVGEERISDGVMEINDNDPELGIGGGDLKEVGFVFTDIQIPQGAHIASATIHMLADTDWSITNDLEIWGMATDSAQVLTTDNGNITYRATTSTSTDWSGVEEWVDDFAYNTPDISALVQEIVDRDGWKPGNTMGFVVENTNGSGTRRFEGYDGDGYAPYIEIDYTAVVEDVSGNGHHGGLLPVTLPATRGATSTLIDNSDDPDIHQHLSSGAQNVWINDQEGFLFYINNSNSAYMASTTDGGLTWGNIQQVDSVNASDAMRVNIWYDRWTPGDTTGNIIHISTFDSGTDDLYYTEYNTITNQLSTTIDTSSVGTGLANGSHGSITKAEDGTLYHVVQDSSYTTFDICNVNGTDCTNNANWSTITDPTTVENDYGLLIPVPGTDNVMLINWDISSNDIDSNIYSATSSSWWGFVELDPSVPDNFEYDGNLFGATINKLTNKIYLALVDDAGAYTANDNDLTIWEYDVSDHTWGQISEPLTNTLGGLTGASIAIDEGSGDLYVAYSKMQQLGATTSAAMYYIVSEDDGVTWSDPTTVTTMNVSEIVGARLNLMSDERIGVTWHWDSGDYGDDYFYATVVDLNQGDSDVKLRPGAIGTGMEFDGDDDYIRASTTASTQITGDVTFGGWVRADTISNSAVMFYAGGGEVESTETNELYLARWRTTSGNDIQYKHEYGAGGTNDPVIFDTNLTTDEWYHIMLVRTVSDDTIRLYVDGEEFGTGDSPYDSDPTGGTETFLGVGGDGIDNFDGIIDDFRIYNRALTASEINRLYGLGATTKVSKTLSNNPNLTNGLVGHWSFDGEHTNWSSTTAEFSDVSGSGNDGNASSDIRAVVGTVGQGIEFEGTNDSVFSSDIPQMGASDPVSIAAWVYPHDDGSSNYGLILQKGSGLTPVNDGFSFGFSGFGVSTLYFTVDCTGADMESRMTEAINLNEWTHVAVVWDGGMTASDVDFYFNGIAKTPGATTNCTGSIEDHTSRDVGIGLANNNGGDWDGLMDDVRLYNRELTAEDIQRIYELGATTKISKTVSINPDLKNGLVGHWTFDGDLGTQISDISGNGAHAYFGSDAQATTTMVQPGRFGQAIVFDGIDDFIQTPNSTVENEANFSIAAWLKHDSVDYGDTEFPWWAGDVTGNGFGATHEIHSYVNPSDDDNNYGIWIEAGAGDLNDAGPPLATSTWQHVVWVLEDVDTSTADTSIYIDGVLVTTDSTTAAPQRGDFDTNLRIGGPPAGTRYYEGLIDDFRIYDRAISAEEVLKLYQLGQ